MLSVAVLVLIILAIGVPVMVAVKNKKEPATASRFLSVTSITEKLLLLIRRFPVSILLVAGLALLCVMAINGNWSDISFQCWLFVSIGAFISVAATLFAEDFFDGLKTYGVALAAVVLWGVYCFLLPAGDTFHISKGIEIFAIGFAVFWSMFFISFLKHNNDRAFWNFTTQTLLQIALACCFAGILFAGLSLALLAVYTLFGLLIDGEVYAYLAVVCFALFAPLYFLANIPDKADKHIAEMYYTKAQKILALYILAPILAIYALILYAYLFKIIFIWQLPDGWVSWLVTTLALGGLLVITFLFPVREQGNNKAVNFISRWFGLIILPLLLLMSIGIFRRIGDYGLTINRVYMLLLNLWFYGIYIYLFLTNSRHVKWILISPVVIGLVVSVGFWSVANVTRYSLTREVKTVFGKPVSADEAKTIFAGMTQEKRERMTSALEYLHSNYGRESVQPFFSDTVNAYSWNFLDRLGVKKNYATTRSEWFSFDEESKNPLNIEPYDTFLPVKFIWHNDKSNVQYSIETKKITIDTDKRAFVIPIKETVREYLKSGAGNRKERIIQGNDYTLWITYFSGYYYEAQDSIDLNRFEGCLFYRK